MTTELPDLKTILSASDDTPPSGHTGVIALLGRPNTGKSTFLNTLLGCHLAAVSDKPQTTRRQLLGIYNDTDSQLLFLDAPGVHHARLAIDEAMDLSISRSLDEADIIVCLADPTREPGAEDFMVAQLAARAAKPLLLVLNKADLATPEQQRKTLGFYRQEIPDAPSTTLTATDSASVAKLVALLKERLPVGPFLFDRDNVTDAYERDIAAELIREVLLEELQKEIPHCIAVTIDTWHATEKEIAISATLNLERENHKGIIIGHGGTMIRRLRQLAAARIAEFCQAKVRLELHIKIVPNWRKQLHYLRDFRLLPGKS